jgi:hypothetical protein
MTVRARPDTFQQLIVVVAISFSLAAPAHADDVFHDYQLGQQIAAACIDSADIMADALACVGEPTRQCEDPDSPWPWKPKRDCTWRGSPSGWGEARMWEDIYQIEAMRKLVWAREFDAWYLSVDGITDALYTVMNAELAWRHYAYTFCAIYELPDAHNSYAYRIANDPPCMSRMFAERIFYLRSLTNMLPRDEGD